LDVAKALATDGFVEGRGVENVYIRCPIPKAKAAVSTQETTAQPFKLHMVRRRTTLSLIEEDVVQCYGIGGQKGCSISVEYCPPEPPQFPIFLSSYTFDPAKGLGAKAIAEKRSKIAFTTDNDKIKKKLGETWDKVLAGGIDVSQNDVRLELAMSDLVKFAIRDFPTLRFHVDGMKNNIKGLPGASTGYKRALLSDLKLCAYWEIPVDGTEIVSKAVAIVADFAISFLPFSGWIKKGAKAAAMGVDYVAKALIAGGTIAKVEQKLIISSRCNFQSNEMVGSLQDGRRP